MHYFSYFAKKHIDCGYSLGPLCRGGSNEYPQSMFWAGIWKISEFFIWKFSFRLVVKWSIYLNRRVFVMGQRRPWSDCVNAQSDQGLRCPHTALMYFTWVALCYFLIFRCLLCNLKTIWSGNYIYQHYDIYLSPAIATYLIFLFCLQLYYLV